MDRRQELRDFLVSRRARITPQQAGLRDYSTSARRVPGLRRSELATLANVSVEYLTKLERGNAVGVSDTVLAGVARALQLDAAETAHLFDLARGPRPADTAARRPAQQKVRPGVQQLLDAMTAIPAFVQNGRLDILASNALARALYSDLLGPAGQDPAGPPPNHGRYNFLDARSVDFYPEWQRAAGDAVAMLRAEVGRSPGDRKLNELIGELTSRSDQFSAMWATHNVRVHTSGVKRYRHPVVGELGLAFEGMPLPGDPGQLLVTFTAEPGSASHEALAILASWHAPHREDVTDRAGARREE